MKIDEMWPPDDEWVPYALPWAEGRCIPEHRMRQDGDKWIHEWRYPKPTEDGEWPGEEEEDED